MKTTTIKSGCILLATTMILWLNAIPAGADPQRQIRLAEAIELALAGNIELQISQTAIETGQGQLTAAGGAFDTTFSAGAAGSENRLRSLEAYGMNRQYGLDWQAGVNKKFTSGTMVDLNWKNQRLDNDFNPAAYDPAYSSSLTIGVTQPLWRGGTKEMQTADLRSSEKQLQAAAMAVADQRAILISRVKKAYWELLFAHQDIAVRQLSLDLARSLQAESREKIAAGLLAPVEIHYPDAEVARREAMLIYGIQNIGRAEDALKLLLNSDWQATLLPTDEPRVREEGCDLDQVIDQALKNRPDLQIADRLIEVAEINAEVAADNLAPFLNLTGAAGLDGLDNDFPGSLTDYFEPNTYWQLGIQFSLPLGNSAAEGRKIQAKAAVNRALAEKELLRQSIIQAARDAVRNVQFAEKTIEATTKTLTASEKGLETEKAKFETGLSTANDVLDAQDKYRLDLIGKQRAKIDYARALADLDRVMGI